MNLQYLFARIWFAILRAFARLPRLVLWPLLIILLFPAMVAAVIVAVLLVILGYLRLLWFRLFPPQARRDVSRLGGDDTSLDIVSEAVEDEGKPLKEHHRRLIYRDPRLLPKPRLPANIWPRPKHKKVMTAGDANRLFAGTMRSRDRRIRDLLPDAEQLKRFNLPFWKNEKEVAAALKLSPGQLRHYSIHRNAERAPHYISFAIPKRSGGQRVIMAPKRRLKQLQRDLLRLLVARLPVSEHAHGFIPGRSVRTGAQQHSKKAVVLSMDLQGFFPSVTFGRVRGFLIALGYGYEVATILAVLMTESERQPVEIDGKILYSPVTPRYCVQGAPTSPGLCNAICMKLDRRLAGLAAKYGWTYTRYADDMTFSGDSVEHLHAIRNFARRICVEEGFNINAKKTRVSRRSRRQTVTGVVVNDGPGLSRRDRRRVRAAIHQFNLGGEDASDRTSLLRHLRGKLAYIKMLNPEQAEALANKLKA